MQMLHQMQLSPCLRFLDSKFGEESNIISKVFIELLYPLI